MIIQTDGYTTVYLIDGAIRASGVNAAAGGFPAAIRQTRLTEKQARPLASLLLQGASDARLIRCARRHGVRLAMSFGEILPEL